MISVIIPLYNKSEYILNTLDSLRNQKYKNFELIIIDDGSSDDSLKKVQEYYSIDNIKIFTQVNKGVSYTRNKGAEYASRKFLFFLDADDSLTADCLDSFYNLVKKNNDIDIFVSNFNLRVFDIEHKFCKLDVESLIDKPYKEFYKHNIFFRLGNVLINRELFLKYKFNENISFYEDFEFFIRVIDKAKVYYTNKVLFKYDMDNSELSLANVKVDNDILNFVNVKYDNLYKTLIIYDLIYASLMKRIRSSDVAGTLYFVKRINVKLLLLPILKFFSIIMKS